MRTHKFLAPLTIAAMIFASVGFALPAGATSSWDLTGSYTIEFTCTSGCAGLYPHSMTIDVIDTGTGAFSGTGYYIPSPGITWVVGGTIIGSALDFDIDYDASAYHVDLVGSVVGGVLSGTAASNASQTFTWVTTSGLATYITSGMIIEPEVDEIVTGLTDLVAVYDDGDAVNDDAVQWAVRQGTCAAGVGTIFGNVDGYSDSYNWDGANFSAVLDTSGLTPGMYCFVFNPTDDPGQNNVRETREFLVASATVNGGGHILQGDSKRKTLTDVSFGGWFADIGSDILGEWQINFHNVAGTSLDKATFHTTNVTEYNLYNGDSATCVEAMNFTALGTLNGEDGYKVIFRSGDSAMPASDMPDDTVRITLYQGATMIYDTYSEFAAESSCVGTARTNLDTGNITIVDNDQLVKKQLESRPKGRLSILTNNLDFILV